jgi:hypothetical protein
VILWLITQGMIMSSSWAMALLGAIFLISLSALILL